MPELATYARLDDAIGQVTIDDGKANALSTAMQAAVHAALDQAEADEVVVVLTGREGKFSAGFDLRCPPEEWPAMLVGGAQLAKRVLEFPRPVVAACNGHAIAMGAFLALSCDHRVGAEGDFKLGLNEVAIGMTVPWFGIEIARHRLTKPYFDRCMVTGLLMGPEEAQIAGILDEVVAPGAVADRAAEVARSLAGLDMKSHLATKLRVREQVVAGVQDGIDRILGEGREW